MEKEITVIEECAKYPKAKIFAFFWLVQEGKIPTTKGEINGGLTEKRIAKNCTENVLNEQLSQKGYNIVLLSRLERKEV
jgi:hypothetical protein